MIVCIELGLEQQESSYPPNHSLDIPDFVNRQSATQKFILAIGQPLLDYLVAANSVVPNPLRDDRAEFLYHSE